jgi:aryl-alcohol dehydrogenase-like predicted oxidoreductase
MRPDSKFTGDDLRKVDPKFQPPRLEQYLKAVERLDQFAQETYGKRVIHLAVRWLLDQPGVSVALWGARHPQQVSPLDDMLGWSLSAEAMRTVDKILRETVADPVGPEFMAPPAQAA